MMKIRIIGALFVFLLSLPALAAANPDGPIGTVWLDVGGSFSTDGTWESKPYRRTITEHVGSVSYSGTPTKVTHSFRRDRLAAGFGYVASERITARLGFSFHTSEEVAILPSYYLTTSYQTGSDPYVKPNEFIGYYSSVDRQIWDVNVGVRLYLRVPGIDS